MNNPIMTLQQEVEQLRNRLEQVKNLIREEEETKQKRLREENAALIEEYEKLDNEERPKYIKEIPATLIFDFNGYHCYVRAKAEGSFNKLIKNEHFQVCESIYEVLFKKEIKEIEKKRDHLHDLRNELYQKGINL